MEDNHNGYDIRRVDKTIRSMISLNHKQKNVTTPKTKNTINYKGSVVIPDLLRHIRNAFAHCNIGSVKGSMVFTFFDEYNGTCSMSGSMDKALLYKLIKEIKKTRKDETV